MLLMLILQTFLSGQALIKSIQKNTRKKEWLTYWVVFGSFLIFDMFSNIIVKFIPFYFVHGKSMLVLGTACIIIMASGYIFASVPVALFLAADSLIKIGFGIWMLFFARPTKAFISAPKTETGNKL